MTLKLIQCRTLGDFMPIAEKMKEAAQKYPCDEPQGYSNTETEAMERTRNDKHQFGRWMHEVGLAVAIEYEPTSILSLSISLETFARKCYRLSMCRITGPAAFAPVPEAVASMIANVFFGAKAEHSVFFGAKAEQVTNPSGIENATHFVCYEEE
jgi:hypothetical protein